MEHNYKNKYGTDLGAVQSKLRESKAASRFMRQAASGKLMAFAHAMEKYNQPVYNEKTQRYEDPPGPPWDVEGHTCEDIYVHIPMKVFSREFIPDYVEKFKRWIEDSYEESLDKKITLKGLKSFFRWLWAMRVWLAPNHEYWAFVVDSFTAYKSGIAEEIAEERVGGHKNLMKLMQSGYDNYRKLENEIIAELTDEVLIERLKSTHDRINSYMWVEKNDPTCIIINESIRKFDFKNGWSDKEMLANVERWFYWVLNMRVEITDSKGKCSWLS